MALLDRRPNVSQHAKFNQNWSKSCWDITIYRFIKSQPSATLDLWGTFWDNWWRVLGDIYHYAKFGWNCSSSFDSMKVCAIGLKTPIYSSNFFWGGGGIWPPLGAVSTISPKGTSRVETHHMTYM